MLACRLICTAVVLVIWQTGTPMDYSAALVPVAGAIAGVLFRAFIRSAMDSVGPREDHRPMAFAIAAVVLLVAIIGSAVGISSGNGFVGLSFGLVAGTLVGGLLCWFAMIMQGL